MKKINYPPKKINTNQYTYIRKRRYDKSQDLFEYVNKEIKYDIFYVSVYNHNIIYSTILQNLNLFEKYFKKAVRRQNFKKQLEKILK